MSNTKDIQMLAEALLIARGAAQRLGIEFGGENITFANDNKTAKSKPEGKRQKVDRYSMLITTGARLSKAELLKKI